jgi:hypothetical protein
VINGLLREREKLRPLQLKEVLATAFFGREPGLELIAAFAGSLPFGDQTTGSGYLSQVHTQYSYYRPLRGASPTVVKLELRPTRSHRIAAGR